jgi:copper(I)-binding protein
MGRITVTNLRANLTLPSDTGSLWMEIFNGTGEDDALLGAEVPGCAVIELHNMMMENDVMVMRQVEGGKIPLPAGETVELQQGGLHVMCIGKEAPLEAGSMIDIVLHFENADDIALTAEVVAPGEMPANMGGE